MSAQTQQSSQRLFLAGHAAVDFLNSAYSPPGQSIETLVDGRALLDWMTEAKLIDQEDATAFTRRFGRKALDATASEARAVREWARTWLSEWRESPGRDYRDEVATLNKLLARETRERELLTTKQGLQLRERWQFKEAGALLAPIAGSIADLVAHEDPALVRSCAGTECTLWFVDRTKAHRRMFCSATACGNRAKVAAFRRRQRE